MSFASVSFLLFFLVVLLLLLLVQRVLDAVLNSDNDGLVHLVGDNDAHTGLSQITFHALPSLLSVLGILLSQDGHHAGDVLLNGLDANGVVQLVDGVLKAQVEEFGLQVLELLVQLDIGHFAQFSGFHSASPSFTCLLYTSPSPRDTR